MLVWTAIIIVFTPLCFQDKSSGSFYYAKLSFSLQEMKIPSSEYKYPRARVFLRLSLMLFKMTIID